MDFQPLALFSSSLKIYLYTLIPTRNFEYPIFLNEYTEAAIRQEKVAKDEVERQKALKENEQKSNSTRNDF